MTTDSRAGSASAEGSALTPVETDALVQLLRTGRNLQDAVDALGLPLSTVWRTARTDSRLAIALAGRDPDAREEDGRAARADYLRLLALGVSAAHAELIVGVGQTDRWRALDPLFASAASAAVEVAADYRVLRRSRMTVAGVRRFLDCLREGTSVRAAARATGVTTQAIYQRRHRDPAFAAAMDDARAAGDRGTAGARHSDGTETAGSSRTRGRTSAV